MKEKRKPPREEEQMMAAKFSSVKTIGREKRLRGGSKGEPATGKEKASTGKQEKRLT